MEILRIGEYYNFVSRAGDMNSAVIYPEDLLKIVEMQVSEKKWKYSKEPVKSFRLVLYNETRQKRHTVVVGENFHTVLRHNYVASMRNKLGLLVALLDSETI